MAKKPAPKSVATSDVARVVGRQSRPTAQKGMKVGLLARGNLDSIQYNRNFLKQVIVRVDFLNPIPEIESALPKKIRQSVIKKFPIEEPRSTVAQKLQISPQEISARSEHFTEWRFHSRNSEKTLTIVPQSFFVEHRTYVTYEPVRDEFVALLNVFLEAFTNVQTSRLGLRYVNHIELDQARPRDWSGLLNRQLLELFSFPPEGHSEALSRLFHIVEFTFDEFQLRFQCGMHNPDYPARIKKKVFVIDMDAYQQGFVDAQDIPQSLDLFHVTIQNYFELSIDDGLREQMNG
jgi:uncharacterized protein (TIGR04255 family)